MGDRAHASLHSKARETLIRYVIPDQLGDLHNQKPMAAGAKNKAYAPTAIGFQYVSSVLQSFLSVIQSSFCPPELSSVILSEAKDLSPFGRQIMNQIFGCRTPFIYGLPSLGFPLRIQ